MPTPKQNVAMLNRLDEMSIPDAIEVISGAKRGKLVCHRTLIIFAPTSMHSVECRRVGVWLMNNRRAIQAFLRDFYASASAWAVLDRYSGSVSRTVDLQRDRHAAARPDVVEDVVDVTPPTSAMAALAPDYVRAAP